MDGLAICAGYGGLELGIRGAIPGYRCVAYVERDAYAAATLVQNFSRSALDEAPVWDDLETFDGAAWRGCVDLVSAGFPCQDISIAGKGAGLDGERSGLWFEVLRTIRAMGCRYVVLENVAAITIRGLDRIAISAVADKTIQANNRPPPKCGLGGRPDGDCSLTNVLSRISAAQFQYELSTRSAVKHLPA